jgi:cell division protein FtsW
LTVVLLILTIGVVMVTSAGYIIAAGKFNDGLFFTKKQGLAMLLGLGIMYVFSIVNPNFWRRAAFLDGPSSSSRPGLCARQASKWVVPSMDTPASGVLPSAFRDHKVRSDNVHSRLTGQKGAGIKDFAVGFLPQVLVMGIVVFFILRQPDFGTAVILTVVGFLMLFVAGGRLQHLLGCAVLCLPFLVQVAMSAPYRILRLKTYFDPWHDPMNSGFQIIQSLVAFGCGGFWGVGVGQGMQKLFYLPQPHTDFIFAVVGEELGLVGVIFLILLFYLLICRGLAVAIRSGDSFQRYLAFGITSLIGLQAMVNMAVTMGMLPTKGLPLPLVSVGGTSLVMNLAGIGILMAITRTTQAAASEEKP